MTNITIEVNGACARVVERQGPLTSGMVGTTVTFRFNSDWDGLLKTAVFRAGGVTRDVANIDTTAKIPPEVLRKAGAILHIGVYGCNENGTLIIPTVEAVAGAVAIGADPSGDESTNPDLPVWAQIQADMAQLKNPIPPIAEADEGKYLKVENGAAVWGALEIPEQYGLVTYNQNHTITIT